MLEPGTERVQLEPIPLNMPNDMRVVPSNEGILELRTNSSWPLILFLFFVLLALLVVFGVGQRTSAFVITGMIVAATLLFLTLLIDWDHGVTVTRAWRFAPGRISREVRLPLPVRLLPREFVDVDAFEIVHTLWTTGIFRRSLHGGHQDTLRFWGGGGSKPVTIMARGMRYSDATLRGGLFTQDRAGEIEREVLPEVLAVAFLAALKVGVPLYVIEKTYYVGTDSDG